MDATFPSQWLKIAERICAHCYAELLDHVERFGEHGQAFCAHDNADLAASLVDDLTTRGFPMEGFGRNRELVGKAVVELRPDDAILIRRLVAAARSSIA